MSGLTSLAQNWSTFPAPTKSVSAPLWILSRRVKKLCSRYSSHNDKKKNKDTRVKITCLGGYEVHPPFSYPPAQISCATQHIQQLLTLLHVSMLQHTMHMKLGSCFLVCNTFSLPCHALTLTLLWNCSKFLPLSPSIGQQATVSCSGGCKKQKKKDKQGPHLLRVYILEIYEMEITVSLCANYTLNMIAKVTTDVGVCTAVMKVKLSFRMNIMEEPNKGSLFAALTEQSQFIKQVTVA